MLRAILQRSYKPQLNNLTHIRFFAQNPSTRVCIVGAGPAGFYAAQHILKHLPNSNVDVIDKLPVPFGLVR